MTMPNGFLWGAATSSYQIEGAANEDGRGKSIWDTFCKVPGAIANGDNGDIANDHYHRYKEDVALMKSLNLQAYRFSFAWPRLFPEGIGKREERGFDFYDRLIDELLANGITPYGTLYHWDLPQALEDKGGWRNREIVNWFGDYATAIGERFGDRVKNFFPINEPWVVAWLGHGVGIHAPGHKNRREAFAAAHHTVLAHAAATKALRAVRNDLRIGPVLNQAQYVPDDWNDANQSHAAKLLDAIQNRFWMEGIFAAKYPQEIFDDFGSELSDVIKPGDLESAQVKNDLLGINFYFDTRVAKPKSGEIDPFDFSATWNLNIDSTPQGPLTDMGWPITPEGLENLLVHWHREFGDKLPPIYITENGVAYDDAPNAEGKVTDVRRIDYLAKHLKAVKNAAAKGAPMAGYFQWSLMDNFEWALGYEKRFGMVYVDFETQKRTIKDSGYWYRDQIKSNGAGI